MALPIFEFIINPEDETMGMKAISLVDKPAIESEYIAFNKAEKKQMYFKVDDKKYIVAGLALIPDKLIYRVDEATGEEYFGFFSAETIEAIMDKFMKESTSGTLKDVNFQHNPENKTQAHLVESFILRTPEMVEAVKAMGIEEAVLGAWFVSYKFDNSEAYEKAVAGEFTGFSVEVILQRELKLNKNYDNNKNKIMTKFKSFIDKVKTLLNEVENNLEDVVVPDSGKSLRFGEIGQPVLWVMIDEAGTEVTEPATEGEYILEDGRTLVVDAQGNLAEIKDVETPVAPIPEEEMGKVETPVAPVETPLVESGETTPVVPEETPVVDVASKTLGEIVDVSKDGEYEIKVVVSGGMITEATAEASQNLIGETLAARESEITALKAEIENLKAELAKPIVKSAFTEFTTVKEKTIDKTKMSNLDYQLARLGLSEKNK